MSDRYRTGRTLGRTLYRDDQLIGIMDTPEDAQLVVNALNLMGETFGDSIPPARMSASENSTPAPVDVSWVTTEPYPKPLKHPKWWGVGIFLACLAVCTVVGALIAEVAN